MRLGTIMAAGAAITITTSMASAGIIDIRMDFGNKQAAPTGGTWNTVTTEVAATSALDYSTGLTDTTVNGVIKYQLGHNGSGSMQNTYTGSTTANWNTANAGPSWLDASKDAAKDALKGSNAVGFLLTFSGLDPNQLYDVEVISSYYTSSYTDPANGFTITAVGATTIQRTAWKAYASGYVAGNWLSWLQFQPKADGTITISSPGGAANTAGVINAARLSTIIPEPASLALMAIGGLVIGVRGRGRGRRHG